LGRNGHTLELLNGKFVLFGGILEITKESDEAFFFDPETNTWNTIECAPVFDHNAQSPTNNFLNESNFDDTL